MRPKIMYLAALLLLLSSLSSCVYYVPLETTEAGTGCVEHIPREIPAVVPTCQTEGSTAGLVCEACGALLLTPTAIPKTVHTYQETVRAPATPHAAGEKELLCSCGDRQTVSYEMQKMTAEELYRYALPALVEIATYDAQGTALKLGSGFVYAADGKILTNQHVLQDAARITVSFANGERYEVTQVLAATATPDLALLQIAATGLPVLPICYESATVGEAVYALGSPRGMSFSLTPGVVGYADRLRNDVVYVQHNAPLSTGNSGGPLFNAYGEIIGINRMTITDAQNLNFAIAPSEISRLLATMP